MNKKNSGALRAAAFAIACALACLVANAQDKQAGSATDSVNPHSPRFEHPWRHGALPTSEQHELMKQWAATNRPVPPAVAAGKAIASMDAVTGDPRTIAYNGGVRGVGVTSSAPRVYLVFWGSQWGAKGTDSAGYTTLSADAKGAAGYLQKLFKGIGTNNELWSGVTTQYCDGPLVATGATTCPAAAPHVGYPYGGTLAGVWYDNASAAPAQATGNQIGSEAVRAAAQFGNTTAASNRYVQYIIVSPSGTHPDGFNTSGGNFCAWHDFTGDTSLHGGAVPSPYGDIAFTNMPYVTDMGGSCGQGFLGGVLDGFSMVAGHEYAETITDQFPAGGWINRTGSAYTGEENADECAWISSGQGATAMIQMATGSFAMQSSWSNDTNRCDLTHPIITGSGGTPVANFSVALSGYTATFTDTSTDTGGAITSRIWAFGDGTTSTATSPAHTYPSAGTYSVTETVLDGASGRSSAKTLGVTVSGGGGTPVAKFTAAANGLTITFTDASTDTGGTISLRTWNFGDGTTGSGASVAHTYAAAGTYSVSETVTDSLNGRASTSTLAITATAPLSQLIANAGFENASPVPWTATQRVYCTTSTCAKLSAHGGAGFAWLNGYGVAHTDYVAQAVSIPAGKASASLTFYLHIETKETTPVAHDTLKLQILNASGVIATPVTWSNINAAPGYILQTVNLNAYIGQTITLRWWGTEDASLATSFVIDDVALTIK